MTLLENYERRINKAGVLYAKSHLNESMSSSAKTTTAVVLNNIARNVRSAKMLNESVSVSRSDLGDYKKFCLTVTNIAFPQLLIEDLVLVKPMSSITGVIAYQKYVYGADKGDVKADTQFADPWSLEKLDENTVQYTGTPVVELVAADSEEFSPAWTPVVGNKVTAIEKEGGKEYEFELVDGKLPITAGRFSKIKYAYDNEVVPAVDVPSIHVKTAHIALMAKSRRIGIEFSQNELFQAQTDYEYDLAKDMAEKAVARLQWEINEEVILFLAKMGSKNICEKAEFNLTLPAGVNKRDHYESFIDSIITARNYTYGMTQKFYPNVLLCSSDTLRVLNFIPNFKAADTANVAGSFIAGTLNGMKVIVSPSIEEGKNYLVVKGNDLETAAAVYGAYMPIAPTQLIETWDGHNRQGFSTMYALAALNEKLVCEFDIVEKERVINTKVSN